MLILQYLLRTLNVRLAYIELSAQTKCGYTLIGIASVLSNQTKGSQVIRKIIHWQFYFIPADHHWIFPPRFHDVCANKVTCGPG